MYIEKFNNDLVLYTNDGADVMQFVDWFSNFAVEQFAFAASNVAFTSDQIAAAFGVTATPTA